MFSALPNEHRRGLSMADASRMSSWRHQAITSATAAVALTITACLNALEQRPGIAPARLSGTARWVDSTSGTVRASCSFSFTGEVDRLYPDSSGGDGKGSGKFVFASSLDTASTPDSIVGPANLTIGFLADTTMAISISPESGFIPDGPMTLWVKAKGRGVLPDSVPPSPWTCQVFTGPGPLGTVIGMSTGNWTAGFR